MLNTSLPRGSVPSKWEVDGEVGCGKISISNPTIGSYIFSGQYDPSRNECKKLKEIKKIKKKYDSFFLICTNFSYTNYFDKKIKYSELLKKRIFFTSKEDLEKWYKYEKVKKKVLDEQIKFLEK